MDSEVFIFDEAQSADGRFIDNEIETWKQIDLRSAQYHEEWKKYYDLDRKRKRLVFLYKLQNNPNSIDWSHWMGWTDPIGSEAESESFKKTIPEFEELTAELDSQMKLIKTLRNQLKRRNSFYEKNTDIFNKLEGILTDELMASQKRMDIARKTQHALGP
jgi:hypothetical protein